MGTDDESLDRSCSESVVPRERARAGSAEVDAPKRAYRAPTIRRLGCVRDLTLGGASGFAEGAGTFIRPRM